MSSRVSLGQLFTDENLHIHHKKSIIDQESTTSLKTTVKKRGPAFGNRKALNDITNKASFSQNVSTKKNFVQKEEFNVAEERFLHDHDKCIETQKSALTSFILDLLLPGIDIASNDGKSGFDEVKDGDDDDDKYLAPEELPVFEISNMFKSSSESRPCSPFRLESPPSSHCAWHFEEVKFTLSRDEDDDKDKDSLSSSFDSFRRKN